MLPAVCFLIAALIAVVSANGGHLTASPLFWTLFFIALGLLLSTLGLIGPVLPWRRGGTP